MDNNFRVQTLLKIAELKKFAVGPLTQTVKQYLDSLAKPKNQYKVAGLKVPGAGTSVIWPGEQAIHEDGTVNILFFFRGGTTDVVSKSNTNAVVITADAGGVGGGPSAQAYGNASFVNNCVATILQQLKDKTKRQDIKLGKLGFASWSGGYHPIHEILKQKGSLVKPPDYVGVFDGMHHGKNGSADPAEMQTWKGMADEAVKGSAQFVVTHSAVNPGSYASSTDTANWLVKNTGLQRQPTTNWSGQGKKPASIAAGGNFQVVQLHDKEEPYKVKDPKTGEMKVNIPGTAGYQHIEAQKSACDYLPNWP